MGEKQSIVEIDQEKHWIVEMDKELSKLSDGAAESRHWTKRSIYKIPGTITRSQERACKPQIFSIGPYHHGEKELEPMQKHKRRALFHFLKRASKSLQMLVEVLTPVVEDAKAAYDQLDSKWSDNTDEFLEMMILDGCFILEILRAANKGKMWHNHKAAEEDYGCNDPIFSYDGMLYVFRNLRFDMLMLENQIPLFVLGKLASVQHEDQFRGEDGLTKMILYFFSQGKVSNGVDKFVGSFHILDIHRRTLVTKEKKHDSTRETGQRQRRRRPGRVIRLSVTELIEAGVTIEKSDSGGVDNITFQDGVLKLPRIVVDDCFETLCVNLMAFERFHIGALNDVTSHVYFMDNIIENADDVNLLESYGIVENILGSDMALVNLLKPLSGEATFDPEGNLDRVCKDLLAYCQTPWARSKAYVRRYYLTTPYATVSVIGASVLFVLTVAQTYFTIWPN